MWFLLTHRVKVLNSAVEIRELFLRSSGEGELTNKLHRHVVNTEEIRQEAQLLGKWLIYQESGAIIENSAELLKKWHNYQGIWRNHPFRAAASYLNRPFHLLQPLIFFITSPN
jgi:hypothetical protein